MGELRDTIRRSALDLGGALLFLVCGVILWVAVGFWCGWTVSWTCLPAGGLLTLVMVFIRCFRAQKPFPVKRFLVSAVAFFLIVAASLTGSLFIFDFSWDGLAYHQEAVIQLQRGWNPFLDEATPEETSHDMELTHWSKGPWFFGAAVYAFTGRIETAKTASALLIWAAVLLAWAALLQFQRLSVVGSLLLALAVGFNPVAVNQYLTFYIDGQLASLLTCIAALAVMLWLRGSGWWEWLLLAAATILCVNVKFTGIAFAGILLTGFTLLLLFHRRWRLFLVTAAVGVVIMLTGVVVVGYNPYITNTIHFGHPFFPMAGPGSYYHDRLLAGQLPADLIPLNRVEKLFVSLFSVSENVPTPQQTRPKAPFGILGDEVHSFQNLCDTRAGGWGPWGGGIMLLALMILVLLGVFQFRTGFLWGGLLTALVLASVLVISETWWARFVPQLWLVPAVPAALALGSSRRTLRLAACALVAAMLVNVAIVGGAYTWGAVSRTLAARSQLQELRSSQEKVVVYYEWFRSLRVRFQEFGITAHEAKTERNLPCAEPRRVVGTWAKYCISNTLPGENQPGRR